MQRLEAARIEAWGGGGDAGGGGGWELGPEVGEEGTRCSDGGSRVCVKVRPGFFISPASADVS
jgi:hypothetical protein